MSVYLRPKVTGATAFFTVTLAERGSGLLVDHVDLLRAAVWRTLLERPARIDAWVVLPDHIHAIWTLPAEDRDHGRRWGAIKARFTMALKVRCDAAADDRRVGRAVGRASARLTPPPIFPTDLPVVRSGRYAGLKPGLRTEKREAAVWQRRFWEHHIRGPEDYEAHVRYCLMNPVKHGLVERPEDWLFSSIHRDIREGRWAAADRDAARALAPERA
ncbi:transposase [Histidinibacterium lentulum]|uniref:Transposase n=1 Tax=Histidinibacterium lentulum TaxID=2480588 RepID=A0A3N2R7W3_9RHOB|nr:transposase [Histidinibacterium lentulum]ROU03508.1 transposase [Histidinibacterium lentulum]